MSVTSGDYSLNHHMMLHVHKPEDGTDAPTLVDVANDFFGWKENRKQLFEKFFYFVEVNTNGKLQTITKSIVDKCSDLTCTKKAFVAYGGWVPRKMRNWNC